MRKLRKFTAFLTAAALCTGMLSALPASAEAWVKLTDSIEWRLEDGTLYVRGTGEMPDFETEGGYFDTGTLIYHPRGVDKLASWYLFHDQIEHIVIEEGITHISEYSFIGCSNAVSVSIPASVESIAYKAFSYCVSIQEITFAEESQLKCIECLAFDYNVNLTEIELPESLIELDGRAFEYTGLTSLHIPKNLTRINNAILNEVPTLAEITVDPENTAFTVEDGILYDKDLTTLYRYPPQKQQKIFFVPDGIELINEEAFSRTQYLKMVYFPDTVYDAENNLFWRTKSVEFIRFPQMIPELPFQCLAECMSLRTLILPYFLENLKNVNIPILEAKQLDIYYPRTQADLEQVEEFSKLINPEYTIHYNSTEDDLVSADISGDGVIDSQDAAHLLSYAAKRGMYFEGGLMLYQHRFANGLVLAAEQQGDAAVPATLVTGTGADAADAAILLQYASAVGSGYDKGLTAFLEQ